MDFTTRMTDQSTLLIEDAQVRYFVDATGRTAQEVADAFLASYHVDPDLDDGEPVSFEIRRFDGTSLGKFWGLPGERADVLR